MKQPPKDFYRLTTLTEARLNKVGDTISAAHDQALDASITAGYGHCHREEMVKKAEAGCPIARRSVDTTDWYSAIVAEKQKRRAYHGSLKPTPTSR